MTSRHFPSWLSAYQSYASISEAPKRMHTWCAIGTIAGALRRKVWIDMRRFMWYPSFYIILVGPPGIVTKSTTIDTGASLLKRIPGIKFGPDSITWQALVTAFAAAAEDFEYAGEWYPMSALTFTSAEFGSLVDLRNNDMVNLLIEMWDGKKSYEKITKMSGNDIISAPWINMMAATTPSWITDTMPPGMIGGGLSSRCIFVYADEKEHFVAYPDEHIHKASDLKHQEDLVEDLIAISELAGPFSISPAARTWGRKWYTDLWESAKRQMDDRMVIGYLARKQTHLHKTGMVLSASRGDSYIIEEEDLNLANLMLGDLERDMPRVFANIGASRKAMDTQRFISYVQAVGGPILLKDAYLQVHTAFPDFNDFEGVVQGAVQSGQLKYATLAGGAALEWCGKATL